MAAVIVLAAAVAAGWAVFWALGLSAVPERPGLSIAGRPPVRVAAAAVVGIIVGGLLAWAFRPAQTLRRTARTWGTTARRRTPRIPLFGSLTAAVVTGVVLAALATWIISGAVFTHAAGAGDVDVVKAALPPIAGAVIAVALVVVYRRQNDTERAQFAQRFGSASTQLGDSDTAVRIADVYAMAAAADEGAVFGQLRIRRYLFRRDVSVNPPGGTQPAIPRCITPRPWPPYLVARESGTGSPPAGQDKDDNLDG